MAIIGVPVSASGVAVAGLLTGLLWLDSAPAFGAAIEEVIVTARKREESLQDVPVSIQVLDAVKIERYDADSLSEIADMANQVEISGGTNGAGGSFTMRGIGSDPGDSGIEASVATNIDGVQAARGFIARTAFFDIQSVQFLKGPQALFFGKNSPAGVVGVVSANPTEVFSSKVSVGYEPEADERIVEGVISGPLSETLGARLALRYSDIDGWIDNNARFVENSAGEVLPPEPYDLPGARGEIGAITTYTGRLTLEWQPTDNFRALAKLLMTDEESDGLVAGEFANCSAPPAARVQPIGWPVLTDPFHDCELDNETSQGSVPVEIARNWNIDLGENYFSDYEAEIASLDLQYDTDWGTITSITGWLAYDFEGWDNFGGLIYPFFIGYNPDEHEQFSQELRFHTELPTPVNFMVGAHFDTFERQHENSSKLAVFGPDPITGFSNDQHVIQFTEGDAWSVFAQVRWDINPRWELAAGGRFVHDEKQGTQRNDYLHLFFQGAFFPEGVDLEADLEDDNFSPEVTLTWRPSDNFTFWGAWKNGFKAGGYSAPTVLSGAFSEDNVTFEPEEAHGFEVGMKSTLLQNRLRLNVTLYDYTFEDLQVSLFNPRTTTYFISNAAEATTTGIEFDAVFQATDELQLYAEFGYNDAEYESYPGAGCYIGQPLGGPRNAVDATGDGICDFQDLSGEKLPNAPELSGSMGFELIRPVTPNWLFGLSGEAIYTDDYNTSGNAQPLAVQESFWRLRARISLQSTDGTWDFSVIGRNLTDEIWPVGPARPGAITAEDQSGGGSRPRSYLFQVTHRL